ncbi:MAG: ABC transporter permease [Acidobacteriota bacterium]|nr:ABC transporter permease [Acidobacteriota bacterium]
MGQIALSVWLLIGAALLAHSFARLKTQPLGFSPTGVLSAHIPLSAARYVRPEQITGFYAQTLARLNVLPDVEVTAAASALPLNESRLGHVSVEGEPVSPLAQRPLTAVQSVTPDYPRVLQIPLLKGRFFRESDSSSSSPVALVNQTFARTLLRNCDPLGKRIRIGKMRQSWEIVGVIADIKNVSLSSPPQAEIDVPFPQLPALQMNC